MRKIIQIAASGHNESYSTQSEESLFALCDDGTVWVSNNRTYWKADEAESRIIPAWYRIEPIPQD